MSNFVREYVQIEDHIGLDELIDTLTAIRQAVPDGAEAELRMRGDDVFGRHMAVCYLRPKSAEEVQTELSYRQPDQSDLAA